MSGQNYRSYKNTPTQSPNIYVLSSQKKSVPNSPFKQSLKFNFLNQKSTPNLQKYALNKTSYGSVMLSQKSGAMSYLDTPNQTSMNALRNNKLKKFKSAKNVDISKLKQAFNSTEDQSVSGQNIKVNFMIGKKKIGQKKFFAFQSIQQIKKQLISLLKLQKQSILDCYGMIGIDPIPYNHGLRLALNNKNSNVQNIINKNIRQVSIQPILVQQKPSFQNIDLSHFQLLKFLGSGGFSNVYLAKCQIDQKICALKFIKKQSITSAKKAKMLQNQKQILFAIDSPHLVDLLYAFQTPNHIVFGLQYCQNGNLYSFLQKYKRIPQPLTHQIFTQILTGLQYLHQNNILFRDLKLENILFDQMGKARITDFGLSKPQTSQDDITYSYCGSPQYMAPQMLAKCGHSFKVDYYALGIILYQLLYGRSPFYAQKKQDIFHAIMNSQPRFPKQPFVSKQAKDLIKGLLIKDPQRRIGSLKGIKQIKAHPWLRQQHQNINHAMLNFPYQNLKISSKQMKQISDTFKYDMFSEGQRKYFFQRSFVNKKAIQDINDNLVVFAKKKQKNDKMIKSHSKNRFLAK